MKEYYEAYDERYAVIHAMGRQWASDTPTPIVMQVAARYGITLSAPILEVGCGEGRDARAMLCAGYNVMATDVSSEAIRYCRNLLPAYAERFRQLDCLRDTHVPRYDMIYAVAVLHMLVEDAHRRAFYAFIRNHLTAQGIALICTMGDGTMCMQTDPARAFELQPRRHAQGQVMVAATTCRMVTFDTFRTELAAAGLAVVEQGVTSAMPEFDCLMYAVVRGA